MDKEKDKNAAHNKGEQDYGRSKERASGQDFFQSFIHAVDLTDNDYDPPEGHGKEYKTGWDNAKKQDK